MPGKWSNISFGPFLLSAFLSILSTSFLFMIALQRFIDFLSIYSLYFYKNSRRDRGWSFYFRDFTIRVISTFSPELLLLYFCGLNSKYIFQFLFSFNYIFYNPFAAMRYKFCSYPLFVCALDSLWIGHFWDIHPSIYPHLRSSNLLKENLSLI